jgi:alpha-tubulin suppressor-like RCC1 family protein
VGHSCAITTTRSEVACWGRNAEGQLGYGVGSDNPNPTSVPDVVGSSDSSTLQGLQSVTLGALHSCAWRASGQVYCWGDDTFHQLGGGTPEGRMPDVIAPGRAQRVRRFGSTR